MNARPPAMMVVYEGNGVWRATRAAVIARADALYEKGETYRIDFEDDHASDDARKHYFATVRDYWNNLPEKLQAEFQTDKELRGYALIRAGFSEHVDIAMGDETLAKRLAKLFERIRRDFFQTYAIIVPRGTTVRIYTPQSQTKRNMKRPQFMSAKAAVFAELEHLTGIKRETLREDPTRNDPPHEFRNAPGVPDRRPEAPHNPPDAASVPADSPPLPTAGASTADAATHPGATGNGSDGPEEKRESGGQQLMPRTYAELVEWTKAWTSFIKHPGRFAERAEKERNHLWPSIEPPLTAGQMNHLESLLEDRAARI